MQYISIDGNQYPFKFGFSGMKKLMARYKLRSIAQLATLQDVLPVDDVPLFVKMGFDTGALIASEAQPFSLEEVETLLDRHLWLIPTAFQVFGEELQAPKEALHLHSEEGAQGSEKNS